MIMPIIIMILMIIIIGFVVTVHEGGHFITAKFLKIPIEEFSIGVGPKIYNHKGKKTNFSIKLFPIGGFVTTGREFKDGKHVCGFKNKSIFKKILFLASGSVMNFISGVLLVIIFLISNGKYVQNNNAIIGEISKNSKSITKLFPKDKIVEINGNKIEQWNEIGKTITMISKTNEKDKPIKILLERNNQRIEVETLLNYRKENDKYFLGVIPEYSKEKFSFVDAVKATGVIVWTILDKKTKYLETIINENEELENIKGHVVTKVVIEKTMKSYVMIMLIFGSFISIVTSLYNLFPIPTLDGGKIVLLILEKFKIKISQKLEVIINYIGFSIIILVFLYITR